MKFEQGNTSEFYDGLSAEVDSYFHARKLRKTGTPFIMLKGAVFLLIYLSAYAGIYLLQHHPLLVMLMAMLMGLAGVSLFLNVVHDAGHGVFHHNKRVNAAAKRLGEFIGLNTYIWNIRHNIQHHVFTNIVGGDLFLQNMPLLRIVPQHPYRRFHRYQHFYCLFFYAFYTFFWTFGMDFKLFMMKDICNLKNLRHPVREWIILVVSKLIFVGYMIVAPALLTEIDWWVLVIAFVLMQVAGGLLGSLIALIPHFIEGPAFPDVVNDTIPGSWGRHELETTVDFAPQSWIWNWLAGGSNTHTAHHLFPHISQAHYYHITPIIERYCREHGYPYVKLTVWQGIKAHYRFLRKLGRGEDQRNTGQA